MAKYLLQDYRGGPAPTGDWAPMDQWTPEEVDAHVQFMHDFAARLEETGEFVDAQALAPEGAFVRYDGEGHPPVTDGPFADTNALPDSFGTSGPGNRVPRLACDNPRHCAKVLNSGD